MTKKAPPEVLSPSDLAYMSILNERDRRWFLATQAVVQIIEPHTAGLPQYANVLWVSLSVTQIMSELSAMGYDISRYFIRQILDTLGLRERSLL